ncbi:unnamed protein product [Discosporangium mesarthrocarpum]
MILFKVNDPWHFGSLHMAMVTLFRCSTLEDWTDTLYINMWGCDRYGYDEQDIKPCDNPQPMGWWSPLYFIFFTVVAALVLLTLFIGVVTTSMDQAQAKMHRELSTETRVSLIVQHVHMDADELDVYRSLFALLDLDGGGVISTEGLAEGLEAIGRHISVHHLDSVLKRADSACVHDGEIDLAVFIQMMIILQDDRNLKRGETDLHAPTAGEVKSSPTVEESVSDLRHAGRGKGQQGSPTENYQINCHGIDDVRRWGEEHRSWQGQDESKACSQSTISSKGEQRGLIEEGACVIGEERATDRSHRDSGTAVGEDDSCRVLEVTPLSNMDDV